MKRRHKVYVLVAFIGIAVLLLAKYIPSLKDLEAPEPAAKYAEKKEKAQIESVTIPKSMPGPLVSESKPQTEPKTADRLVRQPQEVPFRSASSEDMGSKGDAPRPTLPLDKQEAEFPPKRQAEAFTPAEGFEKGKALDDEFEGEAAAEKLQRAGDLSATAAKRAGEARETCDCQLLMEALESARKAALLMSEAVAEAEKTDDPALAQEVYDMVNNVVGQAVSLITEICTYCVHTSFSLETVTCFEENCPRAAEIAELNNATKEAAVAAGAIPTEPPAPYVPPETAPGLEGEPETPIQDHEQPPASPV
jgi:hypothetical protein